MNACRLFLGTLLLCLMGVHSTPSSAGEEPTAPKLPTVEGLAFLRVNEQGAEEWLRLKDRAVMIRVPSGTYLQRPYEGTGEFLEPKAVEVKSFFIDKYELTNDQFSGFVAETISVPPPPDAEPASPGPRLWRRIDRDPEWISIRPRQAHAPAAAYVPLTDRERHPVTIATGHGAVAYAKWVGGRLPQLTEWEKAASGPKGLLFPWGDAKPDATHARFGRPKAVGPVPVGSYRGGTSPYGVMDMAGNVYERVYAPGRKDPVVIKGGSWLSPHPLNLRVLDMCVQPMGVAERSVGFRVVMDDPEPDRPTYKPPKQPMLRLGLDFSEALEEARERNVPLFLSLHFDTCGQCDRMRAQLMRDPAFIAYVNEHLVMLVGHHAGDAAMYALKEDPAERPVFYPGLDETDLHSIFRRGLNAVGEFSVSPGNFLMDPYKVRPASDPDAFLVPEAALSKWGNDVEGYIAAFRRAQAEMKKRYGVPVSRATWLAVQADEEDEADDD
ncbi:MAG: SUMF1/EgtB/PvdO family nonheme iron enzyme [Planctomycetota bacterium]|nr:SUMF1/EgtB/PvdO family nonheme iron enzyme [Planctomycetota bacterium]